MTRPERVISSAPDAEALARDLADAGIACRVEPRAALALLLAAPSAVELLGNAATRATIQRLARARGFTHCAVELGATMHPLVADTAHARGRSPARRT